MSHNETSNLLEAMKQVQIALACWRDEEDYVHPEHGKITSLEEVKYLVVDPAIECHGLSIGEIAIIRDPKDPYWDGETVCLTDFIDGKFEVQCEKNGNSFIFFLHPSLLQKEGE